MRLQIFQSQTVNLMQKPEMQLALRLLEAPTLELTPILTQEIEDNPLLEWEEVPLPQGPSPENLEAKPTLAEHLLNQLEGEAHPHIELLLGYLDSRGLIPNPLEQISWSHGVEVSELESALKTLQTLEPKGVCSTSPQEALLTQLPKGLPAYNLIQNHYDDLLHKRYASLSKTLKLTKEELHSLVEKEIAPLNPYPGSSFSARQSPTPTPDLWIVEDGDRLVPSLGQTPSLHLTPDYRELDKEPQTKRYAAQKIKRAKWVMRALEERKRTLVKVGELLIATQEPFLRDPQETLSPLTLTQAAAELGLHESTLSRAVAHKMVAAPRGLLSLRLYFSHAAAGEASAQALKDRLKRLIASEDKSAPCTDEILAGKLGISRRCVAKYRQQLSIGNARDRRHYK